MGWFGGIVALLVFVWLIIAFPAFRWLVAVVIAGIIGFVYFNNAAYEKRALREWSAVLPGEVRVESPRLGETYGSWKLTGSVINESRLPIIAMKIRVMISDCPEARCVVIGEDTIEPFMNVPPNQKRALDAYVHFSGLPAYSNMQWTYSVLQVRAQP